ncbi:hypothetical protein AIIKEEIJ_03232 [Rhodococcus sp. YH1]|nr:hypothetical protein [Rhodococcus sp. YH1]
MHPRSRNSEPSENCPYTSTATSAYRIVAIAAVSRSSGFVRRHRWAASRFAACSSSHSAVER